MIPEDLRYTDKHEWVTTDGATVRVGITDFAQDALGDIVFVQLPEPGLDGRGRAAAGRGRVDEERLGHPTPR